jgi:hypothetical protein
MKSLIRHFTIGVISAVLALFATICLPWINSLLHSESGEAKPRIVAAVEMKSIQAPKPKEINRHEVHKPVRARPTQTALHAGPRFAMDLGVAGSSGAAAPLDIVNKRSGGGGAKGTNETDDVDERPTPVQPPAFRIPDAVKLAEKDASLVLAFCVDGQGRPYDIRIVEEKPAGLGMGRAGREALQQTSFQPARKSGLPVAFCGLEQPFEVRFSN